jgi:hypothetical protein
MSNALTLNDMSPALRKVVETRSHESHRRKSRMREIRSSGSGEGPGRVTSRPTLQRSFGTAPSAAPWASHPPHPELVRATTNVGWCWTGVSGWVRETP